MRSVFPVGFGESIFYNADRWGRLAPGLARLSHLLSDLYTRRLRKNPSRVPRCSVPIPSSRGSSDRRSCTARLRSPCRLGHHSLKPVSFFSITSALFPCCKAVKKANRLARPPSAQATSTTPTPVLGPSLAGIRRPCSKTEGSESERAVFDL